MLKERLFGLTDTEGNHGEDVKECYFYLDSTPTHSYMKELYKYPQAEFPYDALVEDNGRAAATIRSSSCSTPASSPMAAISTSSPSTRRRNGRHLIRITACNRGPEAAALHLLPTLWFRNTWSWGAGMPSRELRALLGARARVVAATHAELGDFDALPGTARRCSSPRTKATRRLFGAQNASPYVKDSIDDLVVGGRADAVNPALTGTKCAAHFVLDLGPARALRAPGLGGGRRGRPIRRALRRAVLTRRSGGRRILRGAHGAGRPRGGASSPAQANAGLLWSKQFYNYVVGDWLKGTRRPPPPEGSGA